MIDSVRCQDSTEWRSLVVDDSVSGLSTETLKWVTNDERFVVVRNRMNLGPARSWNIGVAEILRRDAQLVAVTVVHADDRLHSTFVRISLNAHRKFPTATAVHSAVVTINQSGRPTMHLRDVAKRVLRPSNVSPVFRSTGDAGLAQILRGNFVFCPSLSYKVAGLVQPLFAERLHQTMDLDLLARLLITGRPIVGVKNRLYYYRRHQRSLTFRNEERGLRFIEEATTYAEISRVATRAGYIESAHVAAKMKIVVLHCLYLLFRAIARFEMSKVVSLRSQLRAIISTRRESLAQLTQRLTESQPEVPE